MIKFITEFLPLVVFFYLFNYYGINTATLGIIITSVISLIITYMYEGKINKMTLFATVILILFGGLTIYSGDSRYIKIKPTIFYLLFATVIFIALYMRIFVLKLILGEAIKLNDNQWKSLSIRWGSFFILIAILNEIVWRNFSDEVWVKFKVFGIIGLTFIFILSQFKLLNQDPTKKMPM